MYEIQLFPIRNNFYTSNFGCKIGNDHSLHVAKAFISKFETDLNKIGKLPRIWHKYVDDTFAIIKRLEMDYIIKMVNNQFPSIKFTYEKDDENIHILQF